MDVTDAAPASTTKPNPGAAFMAAARSAPDFAERMERFNSLSSAVLDRTGKVSEAEKLDAFKAINRMSVTGQLAGMTEIRATLDEVNFKSDVGQRAQALQKEHMAGVMAASSGGAAAAIKAALGHIDGLSKSDQTLLFASLKGPDRSGASEFGSPDAWRDNLNAQLKVVTYMRPNGVFDPDIAAKKGDDPLFKEVFALSSMKNNTSAQWTEMVLKLFESRERQDKVVLSAEARQRVGDVTPSSNGSAYRTGSVASSLA